MTKKTRRNFLKDLGGFALAISGLESIAKLADAKEKFQIPILKQINGIPTKNLNDFKDFDEKYTRLIYNDSKKTGYHLFFVGKRSEFETLIRHGLWSAGPNGSPFPNEEAYVAVEHKSKEDEWVVYETGTSIGKANQTDLRNNVRVINSYPKSQFDFYSIHTHTFDPKSITFFNLLKKSDSNIKSQLKKVVKQKATLKKLFDNNKITHKTYKEKFDRLDHQQVILYSNLSKTLGTFESIFIDEVLKLYPTREDFTSENLINNLYCRNHTITSTIYSPFAIVEYYTKDLKLLGRDSYENALESHFTAFKMPKNTFTEIPSNYPSLSMKFRMYMHGHFEKFQFQKYGVKASMSHYKR